MTKLWSEIEDEQALVRLISGFGDNSKVVIFKHSNRCVLSSMAKNRLFTKPDSRLDYFIIDVISQRPLSDFLSSNTGIQHESPQAFLFVDGVLSLVTSHGDIRPKGISDMLDAAIQI